MQGGLKDHLVKLGTEDNQVTRSHTTCLRLLPKLLLVWLFVSKTTIFGPGTILCIFHILSNFYASLINESYYPILQMGKQGIRGLSNSQGYLTKKKMVEPVFLFTYLYRKVWYFLQCSAKSIILRKK